MYLQHFGLTEYPFALTPDTEFFTGLPQHQAALNVLLIGLTQGEGFIKIVGEVGSGKTLLCRQLLNLLNQQKQPMGSKVAVADFYTAYIPNPNLTSEQLYTAVAEELGLKVSEQTSPHLLLKTTTERLIALHRQGKAVVLMIDEAQAMPERTLEALRLLTNLETEKTKLLQVVLFGQPELDQMLSKPSLRQLKQRITFNYQLAPLASEHIEHYLEHRMRVAGYTGTSIFTKKTKRLLARASGGLPRLINILSHKALLSAFGSGAHRVSPNHVRQAILDTDITSEAKAQVALSPTLKCMGTLLAILLISAAVTIFKASV